MSDKMSQYFEAYYGTDVPLSQQNAVRKPFTTMVKTIQDDLQHQLANADESQIKIGIIEALLYLNSTGQVQTPDLYIRSTHHANEAFRYAIAAANGKPLHRERTPQEASRALEAETESTLQTIEEQKQRDEIRDNVSSALYDEYYRVKAVLIQNGRSAHEAKIESYLGLLDMWEYQGGVDFYVMLMGLPVKEGIYDEQEVIDAQNAHYLFRHLERKQTRFMMNGKKWTGLQ